MKKRIKRGIVLPSLNDACIKKAFEFIERAAPHLTCGMLRYKDNPQACKIRLSAYDIYSLSWYDDDNFLYWGHENFISVKWGNFLGEL